MLKGLLIRRGFHVAELCLAALLLWVAVSAFRDILTPSVDLGLSNPDAPSGSSGDLFARVGTLGDYDTILTSGIFGPAASYEPGKAVVKPPPPPSETTVETSLPLTLKGATTSGDEHILSNATIEVRERGTSIKTYYMNQEIIDQVFLRKVLPKEVIIENKRTNRMESLKLELTGLSAQTPATLDASKLLANARPANRIRSTRAQTVNLIRTDITKKLEDDYEKYASMVDVKVVTDDNGKTVGITTDDLESIPVAKELGFKNGDILVSVNNEKVDGIDKISNIVQKYRSSNTFNIGILRDGKPLYFSYKIR